MYNINVVHHVSNARFQRAAPGQRENTETVAKLPQPAQPRYHVRGDARRALKIT